MEIKFTNVGYRDNILKKDILKDISFTILDNSITGFIGPAGSGKTTILELICALKYASKGWVEIDNYIISKKFKNFFEIKKQIGFVSRNPKKQFFKPTVKEEIAFALSKNKDKRVSDSLKMVGLDDSYLDRNPLDLSLGEQKLLALAIVLAFNPKVFVLDEPLNGLDNESKRYLIKLFKMMKRRYGKTIIIVSEETDLLFEFCDDIHVVNNGKIVKSGDKYTIFSNFNLLKRNGIEMPKTSYFSHLVMKKKGIKMGFRNDINDLIKDIYRHAK